VTDNQVIQLGLQAMVIAGKLAAPILLTALLLGFGISLFQSATQIQETTLSFVPKAVGVGVALLVTGNWMLHELVAFTTTLYGQIPTLLHSG
jgi:flagellar biosynthesis protein FliQ